VEFHEKFPAVKINLISDITPNTVADLKSGKCDVGFVNLPIEKDDELKLYGNCKQLNDIFVAGKKFAELKGKTCSFEDLKNYPLVVLEKKTAARQALDRYLQTLGVTLEPAIEVGSWDLMKRLVASGMGVGVIPREYVQDKMQSGEVFEVKTEPCLPTRSVGMILLKEQSIPYALREFLSLFGFNV
jgi:DNA-binding transcriptional LysR family regulator